MKFVLFASLVFFLAACSTSLEVKSLRISPTLIPNTDLEKAPGSEFSERVATVQRAETLAEEVEEEYLELLDSTENRILSQRGVVLTLGIIGVLSNSYAVYVIASHPETAKGLAALATGVGGYQAFYLSTVDHEPLKERVARIKVVYQLCREEYGKKINSLSGVIRKGADEWNKEIASLDVVLKHMKALIFEIPTPAQTPKASPPTDCKALGSG